MKRDAFCPNTIATIIKIIDSVNEFVGKGVSWCTLIMVILVTVDVFLRYGFSITFVAAQEMEWHLYALVFLLGAGYTLKDNGHVRVDVIYQRLSRRTKAMINILGVILFLFPGCYLVIKTSLPFVYSSWMMHEGSADPGGLPGRYVLKAVIPLAFFLLAMQGVAMLLENICILLGYKLRHRLGDREK